MLCQKILRYVPALGKCPKISYTLVSDKIAYANSADPDQGPVVQSVVSLTSSLRVILLTVLTDSIYNILIFFAEKM